MTGRLLRAVTVVVAGIAVGACTAEQAADSPSAVPATALSTGQFRAFCPEGGGGPQPLLLLGDDVDPAEAAEQSIGGDAATVRLIGQGAPVDAATLGSAFPTADEVWQFAAYDDASGRVVAIDAVWRLADGSYQKGAVITCYYSS